DWLVALSHDSPFEGPQARTAARGGENPPLAAVPSLLSLLEDADPDIRVRAVTALGTLAEELRRVLPALRAALGQVALHDGDANDLICWVAAECLGQRGPAARDAAPALRQALRRDFRLALVRTGVRLAVERIDPQAPAGVGER